uniref:Uncharacterized protein n=1 Tax=Romanomermis culicivorax TaxID=13658 RepID=A0A915KEM6_ROMCU
MASPLRLSGIGSQHGFKFLMNVHQEEYCTHYNVYDGIGFLFGLKENYAPYDFNCDKGFFKMAVGYDVNINIKPTKFIRNTEHLRRCTNKPLVDYDGKHPIPYYRGFCLLAELTCMVQWKFLCMGAKIAIDVLKGFLGGAGAVPLLANVERSLLLNGPHLVIKDPIVLAPENIKAFIHV